MARIRTIKPEFWRDEDLAKISPEAALLAIGLLNHADDEGYFNAHPKLIESDVFPLRELSRSITALIQELAGIGYLQLFSGSDGKRYGQVVTFAKHQVINKPTPSKIKDLILVPEDYGSPTVELPVGKERKGTGNREQGKEDASVDAVSDCDLVVIKGKKREPDMSDENFNRFWAAYDYNNGRHKALKSWKSIAPDAELAEKIISAALVYNKANPTRVYYKHATTWLNGRHWEDDSATLLPKIARQTQHQINQGATAKAIFGTVSPNRIIDVEATHAENATPRLG